MNILQKKPRIKATLKYLVVLVLVLLVTIFQDFLHSRYSEYSFYAAEPFLFNLFWILILPVALILNSTFKKVPALATIQVLLVKRLLFIFLASIVHVFLSAALVHLVSGLFYSQTYAFFGNLKFTVSQELYKYLLIYSVIALVLLRKRTLTLLD
jgi:hypothetical protein